jgi:hypothetical protein
MPTIMPTDKNLRDAIAWIEERRAGCANMPSLLSEAGARYNLTPLEEQALLRFYEQETLRS